MSAREPRHDPIDAPVDEVIDGDEQFAGFQLASVDRGVLTSPPVVRAVGGIAVAVLIVAWPGPTDRVLARLVALGLLLVSVTAVWIWLVARPRRHDRLIVATVSAGLALVIAVSPLGLAALARLLGAWLAVVGVRDVFVALDRRRHHERSWVLARGLLLVGTGAVLAAFPDELMIIVTNTMAIGWIAVSLIVIIVSLDARGDQVVGYSDVTSLLRHWLATRPATVEHRRDLVGRVFYEGTASLARTARFAILMFFATVIAAVGVISDSTAVVIGAMLIAPLMTPLMAMAISLVMGWPARLGRSALIAALGIGIAILGGLLLGATLPAVIDTATNQQIVSRATPTMLDLLIALAAGAAGAYGLSRPDVSDALPGVAISISLVPPLTVVGIAYSQGDVGSGNGALLLFATNALAILAMGGLTFIATGITPVAQVTRNQYRVRTSMAVVGALGALVVGALLLNGDQIAADALRQSRVESTVADRVAEHPEHALVDVSIDDGQVDVVLSGPAEGAPSAAQLAADVSEELGLAITVELRIVLEARDVATSDQGATS